MASLLHWDPKPGILVANQVRTKFGSTVHFSPSPHAKEFFLVVSFSSASFPLTVESVGLALQCCIGGSPSGFQVYQLGKRSFRFSLASNRVGHFIYGLKNRIWPDFVCHFHLFKPSVDYSCLDNGWRLDEEISEVVTRTPIAIKSDLNFLRISASKDHSANSELQKFGFTLVDSLFTEQSHEQVDYPNSNDHDHEVWKKGRILEQDFQSSGIDTLILGSFKSPFNVAPNRRNMSFRGNSFDPRKWDHIPNFMLFHILDQRDFGYSDEKIASIWKLASVPPSEVIFQRLNLCATCRQLGHVIDDCTKTPSDRDTIHNDTPTPPPYEPAQPICNTCGSCDHTYFECPARVICSDCHCLGHTQSYCLEGNIPRLMWRPKNPQQVDRSTKQYTQKNAADVFHPKTRNRPRKRNKDQYLIWRPKQSRNSSYFGKFNNTPEGMSTRKRQISTKREWKIKSNWPQHQDTRRLPIENTGPSMMDGVVPVDNVQDDGIAAWNAHVAQVEHAAEDIVLGANRSQFSFIRGHADESNFRVLPFTKVKQKIQSPREVASSHCMSIRLPLLSADAKLLCWIGGMLKRIYTQTLMPSVCPEGTIFPLNPFAVIQSQLNRFSTLILQNILPEDDVFDTVFRTSLILGFVVDRSAVLCTPNDIDATSSLSLVQPEQHQHIQMQGTTVGGTEVNLEITTTLEATTVLAAEPDSKSNAPDPFHMMICNESAHVDTIQLRRSARSNKYNGFRVPPPSDKKPVASKVKPRKEPFVHCSSHATAPSSATRNGKVSQVVPPPTAIHTIQSIATNMCGMHPSQISTHKLLASHEEKEQVQGALDAE
jgi:hypothetical protein